MLIGWISHVVNAHPPLNIFYPKFRVFLMNLIDFSMSLLFADLVSHFTHFKHNTLIVESKRYYYAKVLSISLIPISRIWWNISRSVFFAFFIYFAHKVQLWKDTCHLMGVYWHHENNVQYFHGFTSSNKFIYLPNNKKMGVSRLLAQAYIFI